MFPETAQTPVLTQMMDVFAVFNDPAGHIWIQTNGSEPELAGFNPSMVLATGGGRPRTLSQVVQTFQVMPERVALFDRKFMCTCLALTYIPAIIVTAKTPDLFLNEKYASDGSLYFLEKFLLFCFNYAVESIFIVSGLYLLQSMYYWLSQCACGCHTDGRGRSTVV